MHPLGFRAPRRHYENFGHASGFKFAVFGRTLVGSRPRQLPTVNWNVFRTLVVHFDSGGAFNWNATVSQFTSILLDPSCVCVRAAADSESPMGYQGVSISADLQRAMLRDCTFDQIQRLCMFPLQAAERESFARSGHVGSNTLRPSTTVAEKTDAQAGQTSKAVPSFYSVSLWYQSGPVR